MNSAEQHIRSLTMALAFMLLLLSSAQEARAADDSVWKQMETAASSEQDRPVRFGGYIESRNQIRTNDADRPVSLRQRIWGETSVGQGELRGFANGYFDYDPAVRDWTNNADEIYRVKLHEAYLTMDTERLDVIAGRKIVRWGAADRVSPLDVINPLDVRDPFATAKVEPRLPIPLIQAIVLLPPLSFEGVFIPRAEVDDLPLPGSPWEPAALNELRARAQTPQVRLLARERPDKWFEDSEFGFRASLTHLGHDVSFVYFNGFTADPVFFRDFPSFFSVRFTPRHIHYQTFGLSWVKGLSRGTIRGELAYKPNLLFSIDPDKPAFFSDNDGVAERDLYQGLIGMDYTFFTSLYVNLQFFIDVIENGGDPLLDKRESHGFTFEVSDLFLNGDLKAGIRGIAYTSDEGYVIEGFADYAYGNHWTISPGVMIFGGPEGTKLGQYGGNDFLSLKVRFSF